MTTIVSVRRGNLVALGGDGQVSLGNTVMKGNARKVRRLYNNQVIAGALVQVYCVVSPSCMDPDVAIAETITSAGGQFTVTLPTPSPRNGP